ncbi:MAG: hypothetical protein HY369_01150 [Candidatus Aenigmarchaeota archaeon]|nr:hypothetical protein [Candidatus Aenigmarchaeota archaeon]
MKRDKPLGVMVVGVALLVAAAALALSDLLLGGLVAIAGVATLAAGLAVRWIRKQLPAKPIT